MPIYATLFAIIMFSSMGLPGLNGFIGEFLILIGAFQVGWWWGAFAVTGIVLGAAYMLWLYQRTMFGEITKEENKTLSDLNAREMATLLPIIALCFWIGLYPSPFLRAMEVSVANVIQTVEKGAAGKAVQGKKAEAGPLGNPAIGQLGEPGIRLIAELPNRLVAASHHREGGR
jgi:NADH-quinone oxidoreductase subunit M